MKTTMKVLDVPLVGVAAGEDGAQPAPPPAPPASDEPSAPILQRPPTGGTRRKDHAPLNLREIAPGVRIHEGGAQTGMPTRRVDHTPVEIRGQVVSGGTRVRIDNPGEDEEPEPPLAAPDAPLALGAPPDPETELAEKEAKKAKAKKAKAALPSESQLRRMRKADLVKLAKAHKTATSGTKGDIIGRLVK